MNATSSKLPRMILASLALAAVTVVWAGCGAANDEPESPAAATGNGSSRKACENVKSLAQVCYDSADPGVTCSALGGAMHTEAAKNGLDMDMQRELAGLCETACTQRKAGRSWSEISQRMDCSTR
ncbi:hypothetical protein BH09MYX1_BH09MYX1_46630 [soil metagenome]